MKYFRQRLHLLLKILSIITIRLECSKKLLKYFKFALFWTSIPHLYFLEHQPLKSNFWQSRDLTKIYTSQVKWKRSFCHEIFIKICIAMLSSQKCTLNWIYVNPTSQTIRWSFISRLWFIVQKNNISNTAREWMYWRFIG